MILSNGAWCPDNGDNARDLQILAERILLSKSCGCGECTCCLTAKLFVYTARGGIVARCPKCGCPLETGIGLAGHVKDYCRNTLCDYRRIDWAETDKERTLT